jgi:uncharacterized membrane protein
MPKPSGEGPVGSKPDPLAGGHEVQYILVGSLIGAILLLIVFALVTLH